ncbi:hypothetical protein SAMN05192569_102542 [Parageobacillus thermantarcticus]|uniref:Uncharacterized protein n=1 Tax=Parageobacillus thermantarcticus TaxID=186116 RepID=A0A1I0THG1_9BACL|nr:hypothetical protein SAMN05192569_102542 [Parageobacillus thermantarcticus]
MRRLLNINEINKEPTLRELLAKRKRGKLFCCTWTLKAEQLPEMACICLADGHFGAVFHY